jgi:cytochrome bd-type quinol oxidase subunit 1
VGNYTFSIVKAGYDQTIKHFDMKGQPVAVTMTLSSNVSSSTKSNSSFSTILIVVVVILVAVIAVVLIMKRRGSNPSDEPTSSF